MTMEIEFESGETGEIASFDGRDALTFEAPCAFAPGAPIRFRAELGFDRGPRTLEGRSLGSKRTETGRFEVRMRFVNLQRDNRRSLAAALEDRPTRAV